MKGKVMMALFILVSVAFQAQPDNPATPAPLNEFEILLILAGLALGVRALSKRISERRMIRA